MSHVSGAKVLVLTGWLALAMSAAAVPTVPITNPESVVIRFAPVDNTPGGPALDGFVTTDFRLDLGVDDIYLVSELLISLDQGGFYRDPLGTPNGRQPTPSEIAQSPSLAFDSFIANKFGASNAGATNLGGDSAAVFPASGGILLNAQWLAGTDFVTNVDDYFDARVTLSEDAFGSFEYLVASSGDVSFREGVIVNGVFVPEPAAGVFVLAGALIGRKHLASATNGI